MEKLYEMKFLGDFIIMGHANYKEGCLSCVESRMQANGHRKAVYSHEIRDLENHFMNHAKFLLKEIQENQFILLNRMNFTLVIADLLSYAMCECRKKNTSMPVMNSKKVSSNAFRAQNITDLSWRLQKYKKSLIHPVIGVFKNLYHSASDYLPMVALEGHIGNRSFDSYGRSYSYEDAYFTSILEGLERLHGITPHYHDSVYASENTLEGKNLISLKNLIFYTELNFKNPNFKLASYNAAKIIPWQSVECICTNKEFWVPEECIYFSSEEVRPLERHIYESSNGIAIGSTTEEAIISGLLELIERDSFLVHWYLKIPPIEIRNIQQIENQKINLMIAYLEKLDYDVHIYDVSMVNQIPAIWVLLENKDLNSKERVSFYTSGGAHFNFQKAIESALIEATTAVKVYNRFARTKFKDKNIDAYLADFNKVVNLEDHIFLFSSSAMKPHLNFALEDAVNVDALIRDRYYQSFARSNISQNDLLKALLSLLKKEHPHILVKDLSSEWLNQMGLSCCKVVIPSMQNIFFGNQYTNINRNRLEQIRSRLNLDQNFEIHQVPHPFP